MIVIADSSETSNIADPFIRQLVQQRFIEVNELDELATIIVEPGDSVADLERASGCPICTDFFGESRFGDDDFAPAFEVLEEHPSCYEMGFILVDSGEATVLFIPKQGIDAELLSLCQTYATPALSTSL